MLVQTIAALHQLGGPGLVRDVEQAFLATAPVLLAAARQGVDDGDAEAVCRSARALQSAAAQIGAVRLQAICLRLEERAPIAGASVLVQTVIRASRELALVRNRLKEATHRMNAVTVKPRVLLVEDNADNRLLFRAMLAERYEVIECQTGLEALETMAGRAVDLVIMDISLPGMDGVETFNRWRADPGLPHVPTIAITAHAMAGDKERLLAQGFDAYLSKPIIADGELLDLAAGLIKANR